jgi:hypothetical protein
MAIFKSDGSSYTSGGTDSLKSYRPGGQDQELFDRYDLEQIILAGSPITYYPSFIDSSFDKVYMESRDTIIAQEGYKLTTVFEPTRPLQNLDMFGIDSNDELVFLFNIRQWQEVVGPMPKVKSLIFAEWNKTWWEILQQDQDEPYKLWTKYRLAIVAKKYQKSRIDQQPDRRDATDFEGNNPDRSLNKDLFSKRIAK